MATDPPRAFALDALRKVSTQGAFAGAVLRSLEGNEQTRAFVTELVYGVLRRRGQLDRALKAASGRRLKDFDPKIHDLLRLGAYQVMFLHVPDHAAVHTTVELAKSKLPRFAGRINQVLRRLVELPENQRLPAPPPLAKDPAVHIAQVCSVSTEVAEVLLETLGPKDALAFSLACLEPVPATFRVNQLRTDRPSLLQDLPSAQEGSLPYSIALAKAGMLPSQLSAVQDGLVSPQDEASMKVVELLDPKPGETNLDLCAAPGGKTCHMAEKMKDEGSIVAYDRLPNRLARVAENKERLGLCCIDVQDVLPPSIPAFDKVLVDAPCSGLGTLRRHPEIRWRFRKADFAELTQTQAKVLQMGSERLKPGGTLVYSVCTISKAEGKDLVRDFLDKNPAFRLESSLLTGPHQPGKPDGFYAARLVKSSKELS